MVWEFWLRASGCRVVSGNSDDWVSVNHMSNFVIAPYDLSELYSTDGSYTDTTARTVYSI